jgi:hypothetical protein
LDELSNTCEVASLSNIGVTDYGFAYALGLIFGGSGLLLEEIDGNESTVVLERHARSTKVSACRADVMKKAGQVVGL